MQRKEETNHANQAEIYTRTPALHQLSCGTRTQRQGRKLNPKRANLVPPNHTRKAPSLKKRRENHGNSRGTGLGTHTAVHRLVPTGVLQQNYGRREHNEKRMYLPGNQLSGTGSAPRSSNNLSRNCGRFLRASYHAPFSPRGSRMKGAPCPWEIPASRPMEATVQALLNASCTSCLCWPKSAP